MRAASPGILSDFEQLRAAASAAEPGGEAYAVFDAIDGSARRGRGAA